MAAPGEEGELFVRGCSNFGGYLKRPQLNNVDADGWFDTGDMARIDADGYIRICGRSKDIIIRGAENIPVVEVEATLFKHPAVPRWPSSATRTSGRASGPAPSWRRSPAPPSISRGCRASI